ncbi:hypothetical protein KAI46_12020 [bacterium]|nr:hypothetical protein [bacterium]
MIINGGNVFDFQSRASEISSRYMLEGLGRIGVDVIGLGVYDLNVGPDRLKRITKKSPVDIVCANVDGYLPFVRYGKGESSLKVLVTSVIDPQLARKGDPDFKGVNDPVLSLRRIQKTIKHDVFIVVLHAFGDRELEIVSQLSGIDLVINGSRLGVFDDIKQIGGTPVVCNNQRGGAYVAYVDLKVDSEKQKTTISKPTVLRAGVGRVAEDKGIVDLVKAYDSERRDFFEKMQIQMVQSKKMQEYANVGIYLSSRSCQHCHPEISHEWKSSRHGKAIESLITKKKENDTDCLPCHVTAMNKNIIGCFVSMSETPGMVGVQCEACHGPGARHAQSRGKIKPQKVAESTCIQCHTVETDPEFDYDRDRMLGTHKMYKNYE